MSVSLKQIRRTPDVLRRFLASISFFAVFYYFTTILTFRWSEYFGRQYATYAATFQVQWILLTAACIIFIMLVVLTKRTRRQFIEETAMVVTAYDALASVLVVLGIGLLIALVYYLTDAAFPISMDQMLFLLPVLSVAAVTETLTWQWFLPRALDTRWTYGYLYAQMAFAIAHPDLSVLSFAALTMLGLAFYYATNPAGNLPFWMNVVFAGGVHVIYNVFAFAYDASAGFVPDTGFGSLGMPAFLFYGLILAILLIVVVGELRSRRRVLA